MKIEIKTRRTGDIIVSGEYADLKEAVVNKKAALSRADLPWADLSGADLSRADLSGADLFGADLAGAYLSGADLSRADLSGANLSGSYLYGANLSGAELAGAHLHGANLSGAVGVNKYRSIPLMMLLDQPGPIRLYKLVTNDYKSPMYPKQLPYVMGEEICEIDADINDNNSCGAGIHVSTLDWCMREWRVDHRILLVEFTAADIACIPVGTDGKIRLHKCRVVGEKDLAEIGLIKKEESDARPD